MSDDWPQIKARLEAVLEDWEAHRSEDATELLDDYDLECLRAALQREEEARELIEVEKKQHLITKHCYDDMQKQVKELERRVYPDDLGIMRDASGLSERCHELVGRLIKQSQRAEAAEAKLAQVVELADHQIPFYAYGDNEAAVEMAHRLESILAAAWGGE